MKRQITFLLILCLFLASYTSVCAAENTEWKNRAAADLVEALGGGEYLSVGEDTVSRGNFTAAAAAVFASGMSEADTGYKDLKQGASFEKGILAAKAMGWISDGDYFYPSNPIKLDEALKILVCAIGGEEAAQNEGGFPKGYRDVSNTLHLTEGISQSETLTESEAVRLIYNALTAPYAHTEYSGVKKKFWFDGDVSYMEKKLEIYKADGIVTDTMHSSLFFDKIITGHEEISIDGEIYLYSGAANDTLLGKHCIAYYKEESDGSKEIISLTAYKNEELVFAAEDFISMDGGQLYYYDGGSKKRAKLDTYDIIYNGRLTHKTLQECLENASGNVRLLDNGGNGYSIVFAEKYEYAEVDSINYEYAVLETKGLGTVEFFVSNAYMSANDIYGGALTVHDFARGDYIALKRSDDGLYVNIIKCSETASGIMQETDGEFITADGERYEMSDEFKEKELPSLQTGKKYIFAKGIYGEIIGLSGTLENLHYGYIQNFWYDEASADDIILRIFSDSGKMETLNAADRISINNEKTKNSDESMKYLKNLSGESRFVKYKTNSRNEVSSLWFAEDFNDSKDADTDNKEKLLRYDFSSEKPVYRSSPNMCGTAFGLDGTLIFGIPSDISDTENYFLKTSSSLVDNTSYTMTAYDIRDNGNARAAVMSAATFMNVSTGDKSFVVAGVTEELMPNGDIGTGLYGWINGEWEMYYLPDNITAQKSSGADIVKGDILRFKASSDRIIQSVRADFDASKEGFGENAASGITYSGGSAYLTYYIGKVYDLNGQYMKLSCTKDVYGEYSYNFYDLKNIKVTTSNILKYDGKTGELRTASLEEIKTYQADGIDNCYAALRVKYLVPELVVIYDNMEE